MRKTRQAGEEAVLPQKPEPARGPSDARLRRLFKQAERTADPHKRAQLKAEFIREFYDGAR